MHAKDTNKGSEGVLWFPVIPVVRVTQCVYLEQAEIPGRTCRYELLPFQRKKAGSSVLLVLLHCFWLYSRTLMNLLLSLWLLLLQDFASRVLSSHSAHKLLRIFISSLDKIPLKPWETAKSSDYIRWSELFLCPDEVLFIQTWLDSTWIWDHTAKLYHLLTAIVCPRLRGGTAHLPVNTIITLL